MSQCQCLFLPLLKLFLQHLDRWRHSPVRLSLRMQLKRILSSLHPHLTLALINESVACPSNESFNASLHFLLHFFSALLPNCNFYYCLAGACRAGWGGGWGVQMHCLCAQFAILFAHVTHNNNNNNNEADISRANAIRKRNSCLTAAAAAGIFTPPTAATPPSLPALLFPSFCLCALPCL